MTMSETKQKCEAEMNQLSTKMKATNDARDWKGCFKAMRKYRRVRKAYLVITGHKKETV